MVTYEREGYSQSIHQTGLLSNPSLSGSWRVNGTDVPVGDPRYTLVAGNLVISGPQFGRDGGSYQCLAINRCGTILSRAANLKFGCEYIDLFIQVLFTILSVLMGTMHIHQHLQDPSCCSSNFIWISSHSIDWFT